MMIFEADKGYDAVWLRQALLVAKIFPLIPLQRNARKRDPRHGRSLPYFSFNNEALDSGKSGCWAQAMVLSAALKLGKDSPDLDRICTHGIDLYRAQSFIWIGS